MLVLFTVAFVVTLTAAVYMQFSSRAEKYVLQYKLDADAFLILGSGIMGVLSLLALANSGLNIYVGFAILLFGWVPCAVIAVRIEKIRENLCKQRALPAGRNAQLAASFGMSEFGTETCEKCLKKGHVRKYFHEQHGWILSLCVDSVKCDANVIYCVVDFADDFVLYTGTWENCNQVMQENYGGLQVIPHANITKQMWLQLRNQL